MTFRVGQKVVCVEDGPTFQPGKMWSMLSSYPVIHGVYTIRDVLLAFSCQYVRLVEVSNPRDNWIPIGYAEPCFWHALFRPVVERKTDISIFTAMLKPSKVQA
jgi:hypothetical protein